MNWVFYILLIVIVLSSCKDSPRDEIARLVKEWDGKEIRFPGSPVLPYKEKIRSISPFAIPNTRW